MADNTSHVSDAEQIGFFKAGAKLGISVMAGLFFTGVLMMLFVGACIFANAAIQATQELVLRGVALLDGEFWSVWGVGIGVAVVSIWSMFMVIAAPEGTGRPTKIALFLTSAITEVLLAFICLSVLRIYSNDTAAPYTEQFAHAFLMLLTACWVSFCTLAQGRLLEHIVMNSKRIRRT